MVVIRALGGVIGEGPEAEAASGGHKGIGRGHWGGS